MNGGTVSVVRGADGDRRDSVPILGSDKCLICLNTLGEQPVGSLDNCRHVFCLECILQWSQTASSCPVDRIGFSFIHQRQYPGGHIQKKIEIKKKTQIFDEDDMREDVICEKCGRSDLRDQLQVCIHCDSGYHIACLTSLLDTNLEGYWVCPECADSLPDTDDEQVSEGELADLQAEVDDAVPTTSRLRPTTLSQPSRSTGTRCSQRIKDRARNNPTTPSHSAGDSLHVPKYLLRSPCTADEFAAGFHGDTKDVPAKLKKGSTKGQNMVLE
ncbi:PHD and RING finger domain-containing protein 1-like [Lampris incognitus]|uniref:PHD and RING finger domain-containing protein 1-like n=1 Tax=Lampris incognitus TaxID=2546036 RepID=UPI0024B52D54|nr:PHD and RING finger domain-containing protein 1-like [Lampris incognitus]